MEIRYVFKRARLCIGAFVRNLKYVEKPHDNTNIAALIEEQCGFRVFYVLKIVWAIGFVMSIAGLFIWNDTNYRRTFFFFLLPLILYGVIIIVDDWIKEDKSK